MTVHMRKRVVSECIVFELEVGGCQEVYRKILLLWHISDQRHHCQAFCLFVYSPLKSGVWTPAAELLKKVSQIGWLYNIDIIFLII